MDNDLLTFSDTIWSQFLMVFLIPYIILHHVESIILSHSHFAKKNILKWFKFSQNVPPKITSFTVHFMYVVEL